MNNNTSTIRIIPMTKDEYLGKEKKLTISYSIVTTAGGKYLIASTTKGICYIMPGESKWEPVENLKKHFPNAHFRCQKVKQHIKAIWLLKQKLEKIKHLDLHLWGTQFQLAVWNELLNIPVGTITTYLNIAQQIEKPNAARPVGGAVGSNPIMYIIPCHRVICSNGKLGGYRWGVNKKIKFLNKEAHTFETTDGKTKWDPTLF